MNRENIEDLYELSPTQQGLLYHSLYSPESWVYFEQFNGSLHGPLNADAFAKAWQRVVDRHTILRTSFYWKEVDKPLQVVHRNVRMPLEWRDWREVPSSDHRQQLNSLLKEDRRHPFDLSQPPLMRLILIRMDENVHHFIWSFHHVLLDGWSVALILQEVFASYEAFCRGANPPLARTRPYRDFIVWLQQHDLSRAEAFWRHTLRGLTSPTPLPMGRTDARVSREDEGYGDRNTLLPAELTTRLQSYARQNQLTINTVVQGAWAILLSLYSGEQDVVYGVTSSGRPAELAGVGTMIGLFVNTLPMRVRRTREVPVTHWLAQLQAQQAQTRQFEYSPLVQVQAWSDVPRGQPLFESIVGFENYPIDESLRERQSIEIRDFNAIERTNYPIALMVNPGARLNLRIVFDSKRFDDGTISRMLGHLGSVLKSVVAHPEQRLEQVSLLTVAERQQLLVAWNDTAATYPRDACIHDFVRARALARPDTPALVFGDEVITYDQLQTRATQLAHFLRGVGVGADTVVGLYLERSPDLVIGMLGTLQAGGAYLPLDSSYPPERLAFMMEDAKASLLLTVESLAHNLERHAAKSFVWTAIGVRLP